MCSGTVYFAAEIEPSTLPAHLAQCLRRVRARHITVEGNRVAFWGGLFRFVTSWNVLVSFGSGELWVDPVGRNVRYRLSIMQLVIRVTVQVVVLGSMMLFIPLPRGAGVFPKPFVLMVCVFMWVWFVGGNVLIGVARFESFLRRSAASAPRDPQVSEDKKSLDPSGRSWSNRVER